MSVYDHFGEKALREVHEVRTASVQAVSATVECLVLHRDDVFRLIGEISDIYPERPIEKIGNQTLQPYAEEESLSITAFKELKVLGMGGFGKVVLVQHGGKFFAQKQILKAKTSDKEIELEKRIMKMSKCDFIVKLCFALSDKDYHYLLMEPCLGGELMTLLQSRSHLTEPHARFYSACAIKAIEFLHHRKIGKELNHVFIHTTINMFSHDISQNLLISLRSANLLKKRSPYIQLIQLYYSLQGHKTRKYFN